MYKIELVRFVEVKHFWRLRDRKLLCCLHSSLKKKAEFELEVSENEVFSPPSQFTGPQVKDVCSREVVLCMKIGHVRRSCEKLLVAPSCLLTWNS
jgi:hypothetical protein